MTIDAHHHFWRYNEVEFGWIDEAMRVIRRDFLPADLQDEMRAAGVDGVISVQARMTVDETRWLLEQARANDFIKGIVGWLSLTADDVREHLEKLCMEKKLRGVRHVVQGEADGYMLREDFNAGVAALREFDLAYDILIFERQLPEAIAFVDRHPNQIFVLDHIAKPRIKDNLVEPWRKNLRELARRENVFCKVSGMVTEANFTSWAEAQLRPFFDATLEAFGPQRTMFGSDWPVCLVACGYARWHEIVRRFAGSFSIVEKAAILGGTAIRAYKLNE